MSKKLPVESGHRLKRNDLVIGLPPISWTPD